MWKIKLYRNENGVVTNVKHKKVYHSPSGFEWGYHGSGPAELALNILLMFTDEDTADLLHQAFKREVIALIPFEGGEIACADVRRWIRNKEDSFEN